MFLIQDKLSRWWILLVLVVASASAQAAERTALVIGNSHYGANPLDNPEHDARAMAETLRTKGFDVEEQIDANLEGMEQALVRFEEKLHSAKVGLFYFAGHAVQVNGSNYLVPVGSDIHAENEVKFRTVDANLILAKMESARTKVNIVILDACRNNPFPSSSRSIARGLAPMTGPTGSMIAFSTAPGQTAQDGSGDQHSPYTKYLLEALAVPGLSIEQVFKQVRARLQVATGNQQTPWENSSLTGEFYFTPKSLSGTPAFPESESEPPANTQHDATEQEAAPKDSESSEPASETARQDSTAPKTLQTQPDSPPAQARTKSPPHDDTSADTRHHEVSNGRHSGKGPDNIAKEAPIELGSGSKNSSKTTDDDTLDKSKMPVFSSYPGR